jgi:hypothetical protein
MKILKANNPLHAAAIAPLVLSFYNKVKKTSHYEGVSYESLHYYLTVCMQGAGGIHDVVEVWIAYDETDTTNYPFGEPVGFAKWNVSGAPHFGKVYVELLYSKLKDKVVSVKLIEEFIKFGERHNALLYSFDAVNPAVAKRLMAISEEVGIHSKETGIVNFIGRKAKV